jgi:diacylglycerol kinase family enzyme
VLKSLRADGFHVDPLPTTGPGDATRLTREAVTMGGIEVAFAMGGDGTLREVAAGLLGSEVALGPLPTGTTNVLALALGLPRQAEAAARILPACSPREIDVGLVGEIPFLMLASCGIDAAIMQRQDGDLKRRFGKAAIGWLAFEQLRTYSFPSFDLRIGNRRENVEFFAVCNIPYYAGAFRLAPDANLGDGLLDLLLFHGHGRSGALGFFRDLFLRRHHRRRDVDIERVEKIELRAPEKVWVQVDGDVVQVQTPVRIGLAPHRLWVLSPSTIFEPSGMS